MNAKLRALLREKGIGTPSTADAPRQEDAGGDPDRGRGRGRRGRGGKGPGSAAARRVPDDGIVRVGRETKGRKGRGVTVVTGVPLSEDDLEALAKELKGLCGAGGTRRGAVIEIQGDHRDRIVGALEGKGRTVKRVGG